MNIPRDSSVSSAEFKRIPWRQAWMLHPAYVLLAILLYLPASRNTLKAGLFAAAILSLGVGWALGRERPRLAKPVAFWLAVYAWAGLFFSARGAVSGAPGTFYALLLYVLWPVVYVFLLSFVSTPLRLARIYSLIVFGCAAVGGTVLSQFLVQSGFLPGWMYIDLGEGVRTAIYDGYTQMASFTIATLVYAVPFVVATLLTVPRDHMFTRRRWLWVALVLGVAGVLLGGRRAALITFALSPVVTWVVWLKLPKTVRRRTARRYLGTLVGVAVAVAVASVALNAAFGWTVAGQGEHLAAAFDVGPQSSDARYEQFGPLMEGWAKDPLLGRGFGTYSSDIIRNEERPWEYELQYVLLGFHTGIIGVLLYSSGMVWVLLNLMRLVKRGGAAGILALPVVVGTVMFLVGNATNPYLAAYGQLWTVFLPVALVNQHRPWRPAGAQPSIRRADPSARRWCRGGMQW